MQKAECVKLYTVVMNLCLFSEAEISHFVTRLQLFCMIIFVFRSLLEEYLQPQYWNLPVTGQTNEHTSSLHEATLQTISRRSLLTVDASSRSIEQLNSNIVLICLLLDSIEQCSLMLRSDFQIHLINVLYPLLEKVGSENARVSRYALHCLHSVAKSADSGSVSVLLQNNADYLVNSISLKLRHIQRYPEAPTVLQVALHHGNITMLPLVSDLILEVSSLHMRLCNVVTEVLVQSYKILLHLFIYRINLRTSD